jgi:hypothetical protein
MLGSSLACKYKTRLTVPNTLAYYRGPGSVKTQFLKCVLQIKFQLIIFSAEGLVSNKLKKLYHFINLKCIASRQKYFKNFFCCSDKKFKSNLKLKNKFKHTFSSNYDCTKPIFQISWAGDGISQLGFYSLV